MLDLEKDLVVQNISYSKISFIIPGEDKVLESPCYATFNRGGDYEFKDITLVLPYDRNNITTPLTRWYLKHLRGQMKLPIKWKEKEVTINRNNFVDNAYKNEEVTVDAIIVTFTKKLISYNHFLFFARIIAMITESETQGKCIAAYYKALGAREKPVGMSYFIFLIKIYNETKGINGHQVFPTLTEDNKKNLNIRMKPKEVDFKEDAQNPYNSRTATILSSILKK
jgi:hypothetical protein